MKRRGGERKFLCILKSLRLQKFDLVRKNKNALSLGTCDSLVRFSVTASADWEKKRLQVGSEMLTFEVFVASNGPGVLSDRLIKFDTNTRQVFLCVVAYKRNSARYIVAFNSDTIANLGRSSAGRLYFLRDGGT